MMPRRARRSFTPNIAVVLVTIGLFFGGIEAALRITGIDKGRPHTPPIYAKSENPDLSYELLPNLQQKAFRSTIVTDRRGFRSAEIHPGKPTIAVMGDSIAFGYGLENDQTLGGRLQTLLGDTVNVVTAAAPGYTLGQQAALYEEKVSLLHPKTIILVFYWNDLTDLEPAVLDDDGNLQAPDWKPGTPTCHPIEEGLLGMLPGRCWLDLHSAFYRTVKKVIVARTEKENLAEQQEQYRENAFAEKPSEGHIGRYAGIFERFANGLPKDTKKLFVIWPEKRLHLDETPLLRTIAEREGFSVLNLYEVFGNKAESLEWDTVHPSAKTVQEAAGIVKAALQEWELLPL